MNHYKEVAMRRVVVLLITVLTGSASLQWIRFQSMCYQADRKLVNRSQAIKLCRERDAILASFSDLKQVDAIKGQLITNNQYWVWLTHHNGGYQWEDGRKCCPRAWWAPNEPNHNDTCVRFRESNGAWLLYDMVCSSTFGFICSKPRVRWTMVNSTEYYLDDLCGVEAMANCDGLSCEEVCESHPGCEKFAKLSNLCIDIKNVSQANNCVIKLRKNLQLFQQENSC